MQLRPLAGERFSTFQLTHVKTDRKEELIAHGSLLKKMEALDTCEVSAYAPPPEAWRRRHAAYLTAKLEPSQIKCFEVPVVVIAGVGPNYACFFRKPCSRGL